MKVVWGIVVLSAAFAIGVAVFATMQVMDMRSEDAQVQEIGEHVLEQTIEEQRMPLYDDFGFLTGGPVTMQGGEMRAAREMGAGWVRPHPGPFVWGQMQETADSEMNFDDTDEIVRAAQDEDVQLLATLWPFADWAIDEHDSCAVEPDVFEKELGIYRCAPVNEDAYQAWVSAVVERYDGDGEDDMPGLEQPVKYWEVLNEPDLGFPQAYNTTAAVTPPVGMQFFKGGPEAYAYLLNMTAPAIRGADDEAQVVLAGAAGGNDAFLDFYRQLFIQPGVIESFDIANVHCISNDDVATLNVGPYAAMLNELEIDKPIWVTEAETVVSDDPALNSTQLLNSVQAAEELGAKKIFFTSIDVEHQHLFEQLTQ